MTQEARRPLHRLTPLRDDPAAAWLTPSQKLRVLVLTRWFSWFLFFLFLRVVFYVQVILLSRTIIFASYRIPAIATGMLFVVLVWPVRRIIMRRVAAKTAALVHDNSPKLGVPIDDFNDLERQPEGTAVSLVGWIRAGARLTQPVGGEPCVGLALACHQRYPGVLETLNDFDLVDEGGHIVPVQVAGARLLGASNVNLTNASERRLVIAALDLPVGAVATGWDAFVLRDGDPIMVVGFKQTALDPTQAALRAPAARAAIVSQPPKPMLIFPIAAERKEPAPSMFGFS